jgi:putative aldouronate transport system substrate-binding protein
MSIKFRGLIPLLVILLSVELFMTGFSSAASKKVLLDPKKPIKLKAVVMYTSLRPNMDTSEIWKYVKDKTGIEVEITYLKNTDQVSLMFASRDYPDVAFNIGAPITLLTEAAKAGDLVCLDELLPAYAPTWNKFFKSQEGRLAYRTSLINGKCYTLPFIEFAPYDRDLRDQWFINDKWLKELGLRTPRTTKEFKDVLRAFKNNAGKGSIPRNAIPLYFPFDNYVGGQMDIYGTFGVVVTTSDYLCVDKGKVKYQAVNPSIKEPLKYLRELYAEGLIPPEVFTDDFATYLAKTSASPPMVGSYFSYENRDLTSYKAMAPLMSPTGKKPFMRRQTYIPGPAHTFMIFSKNPYPEETLAFAEWVVSDVENMMTVSRGVKGVVWDFTKDGKVTDIFWEESPDLMSKHSKQLGLWNSFIALRDRKFHTKLYYNKFKDIEGARPWNFENVYKNHLAPREFSYVGGTLPREETELMNQIGTDLTNLRKTTFSKWISGKGDIEKEWNDFVAENKKLNLDKWLELKQKAYDMVNK